jgi:transcription antitermination factor NusG
LSQIAIAASANALAQAPPLPAAGPRWYAIHTRSRHEKQVQRLLREKTIESFLPLRREVHRWRDRYQQVELPLFSGYVFVRMVPEPEERLRVLRTVGVVRIVGFAQNDAAIPDEQIETLRRLMASDAPLHRHRYLRVGQRIKVISGTLSGVEGTLVRLRKSDRLVISIAQIRQSVAVELSGYDVVPIG